ncbi:MAG: hypothetical protein WDA68_06550, partial [Phycisphaerae bacterium]
LFRFFSVLSLAVKLSISWKIFLTINSIINLIAALVKESAAINVAIFPKKLYKADSIAEKLCDAAHTFLPCAYAKRR